MLDIETVKKGDIVIYTPPYLDSSTTANIEEGIVTSKNDTYVFVRYGRNSLQSKATRPQDLTLQIVWRAKNLLLQNK